MRKPKRGDLVLVTYIDLAGSPNGHVSEADIPLGQSAGWFGGYKKINGMRALIVEVTKWNRPGWNPGWMTWPEGVIKSVEVVIAAGRPNTR